MFESLAGSLRGGVPDRLAQMLDSDPRDTRRAMEVSLPALIGGLRDKTREPGGSMDLAELLDSDDLVAPDALDDFMATGDARTGAGILDRVFGERGEGALTSLSKASGLSTRLLARVMSMLAPVATGWLASKRDEDGLDSAGLATYLEGEVADLEDKGYGKVLALLGGAGAAASLGGVAAGAADAAVTGVSADAAAVTGTTGATGATSASVTAPSGAVTVPSTPTPPDAEIRIGGSTAEADELVEISPNELPDIDQRDELMAGGNSMFSGAGLWWGIAALALLALLILALARCTGGDDTAVETPTPVPTTVNESQPAGEIEQTFSGLTEPELNQVLSIYPGVTGTIQDSVIVLSGQVSDDALRVGAIEAATARAGGMTVQSQITTVEPYTLSRVIESNSGESGQFGTLLGLLQEANLTDALSGAGPFTVFAPVDFAFAEVADLNELRADPARLSELLRYHVVPGTYTVEQLRTLDVLPTLFEGESIRVGVDAAGQVVLNEQFTIPQPDNRADNGILHTITSVLRPTAAVVEEAAGPSELGAALDLSPILFEAGSSVIAAESEIELDAVVDFLAANPQPIEIAGHTDSDGPADYNQTLSQERADAVRQYLINNGVPQDSITAVGFGASQPLVANDSPANKELNRRIEFNLGG